jgi:aspartyl protease family protein
LLCCIVLITAQVQATVVELLSLNKAKNEAEFNIDSRKTKLHTGNFSQQGVYLAKLTADEATIRLRGVEETLPIGRSVIVAQNLLGQPAISLMMDAQGKFTGSFNIVNQGINAWVDVNVPNVIIPAAEAERIRLPYKAEVNQNPNMIGAAKPDPNAVKLDFAKPIKITQGKKSYYHYPIELRSVKLGGIEVFGVKAIVTDDETVTKATFGKSFIVKLDPQWEGSTLTLTRRN